MRAAFSLLIFSSIIWSGCLQSLESISTAANPSIVATVSSPTPSAFSTPPKISLAYPSWVYEARLAGFSFYPDFSDDDIREKVDAAVQQNVSVMLIDTPMGWDYAAWENDADFEKNVALVQRVARRAHENGLRVALYLTGLEVTGPAGVDPLGDHLDWIQVGQDGRPVQFDDISSKQEHWLEKGEVDAWLSPESSYRDFFLNRTRRLAPHVDALWIDTAYLMTSIGGHDELWPSHDAASKAAFQREFGRFSPANFSWESREWKEWVAWRKRSVERFLAYAQTAAKSANPDVLVFAENWNVDAPLATGYAQDPVGVGRFMPTAPEISTVADRSDLGEDAMGKATLEQWQAFAAMVRFSVSANRGAPTWVLTYGARNDDAVRTAGVVLALGGQFYEAKGPSMLDDSVSADFRHRFFSWVKAESRLLSQPRTASVAVWYSPAARDFLDRNGAGFYEEETPFFQSYRGAVRQLLRDHVPFDVVFDVEKLADYDVIVVPSACLTSVEYAALQESSAFVVGAVYDALCEKPLVLESSGRFPSGLVDLPVYVFYAQNSNASFLANVGLLQSVTVAAPSGVVFGRFSSVDGQSVLAVEGDVVRTPAFDGPALIEWLR